MENIERLQEFLHWLINWFLDRDELNESHHPHFFSLSFQLFMFIIFASIEIMEFYRIKMWVEKEWERERMNEDTLTFLIHKWWGWVSHLSTQHDAMQTQTLAYKFMCQNFHLMFTHPLNEKLYSLLSQSFLIQIWNHKFHVKFNFYWFSDIFLAHENAR